MGIKKIARPINKAKNDFVKWLKSENAEMIDIYEGGTYCAEWEYYRMVSAFIGENLYTVCFTIWNDSIQIEYSDDENRYTCFSVEEFRMLMPEIN